MFLSLLRFEAGYQFRQYAFAGFVFIFLAFGFLLGSQGYAPANVDFNSSFRISFNITLLSLGSLFAIMFFTVSGVLRDYQFGMEPIVLGTAVTKWQFFSSRFSGVFLFSLLVFSMTLPGFALGTIVPGLDPERVAPFNIGHYLWTWLIVVVPNVFICTVPVFVVSIWSKNNIATYATAVMLYAFYWVCSIFLNSPLLANAVPAAPENMVIAALADPFGIAAFFEQTQFWTPFQKNTQSISFSGPFMWNRIVWMIFSLLLLFVSFKRFSFKKPDAKSKKAVNPEEEPQIQTTYKRVISNVSGLTYHKTAFWTLVRMEFVNVFKSLSFVALLVTWAVIVITEIYFRINNGGAYNDSLYPTTNLLIWLIVDPLPILSLILIVFYSGELVWREKVLKFSGIVDATPVSNGKFFLSKALVLLMLPMVLIGVSIIIGMGFQIGEGYYNFELGQYLSMFYYQGCVNIFYIALALFVQNLVGNKYFGMVITGVLIIVLGTSFSTMVGIDHPMLRIGRVPAVEFNNMTGFGDYVKPFNHYMLYWGSLGILLVFLSLRLWQRGIVRPFNEKAINLFKGWNYRSRFGVLISTIGFVVFGILIFYNTNVVGEYRTQTEQLDFRENYERLYKKYDVPRQLVPVNMKTKMDIFPQEGKYTFKANYMLENRSKSAVTEIFVSERFPVSSMMFENATLKEVDTVFNIKIFEFDKPLAPGEQVNYSYTLNYEKTGYEINNSIVNNGTFIMQNSIDPVFGYRSSMEIRDEFERSLRELPPREEEDADDGHFHNADVSYIKLPFESIVSTHKDQTAVASGELINSWTKENRNYYHYKFDKAVIPMIAYYSGVYEIQKEPYKGISIEQYIHPGHDFNKSTISKNVKRTLDYCNENFIQYPFDHIRIVEIPGHWGFGGHAQPGTIAMVEDNLYLLDNRNVDNFDLVAKRTIHEVAHQWFGHLMTPKNADGGGVITEGITKYIEAVVMEEYFGKRAIWQLSETAGRAYFRGRAFESDAEPPICYEEGQSYLLYGKSFISLLAVKELIGTEKMNMALNALFEKCIHDPEPKLTSEDLLKALYAVTYEENHRLIVDWFRKVITYDLKAESTAVQKLKNGTYEVTLSVSAKRFETENSGAVKPIPIDEPIQIGVFSKHPRYLDNEHAVLYLKPHRIDKEKMEFKIIVNDLPQFVSVDPLGTRPDENLSNNTIKCE